MGVRELRFSLNVIAEDGRTGRDEAVRQQSQILPGLSGKAGLSSEPSQKQLRSWHSLGGPRAEMGGTSQAWTKAGPENPGVLSALF